MPDTQDMDLVREFARHNSEAAFTELVRRHIALVYSVARRCTGNDGDAQDVTQAVFIILARKAAGLRERTLLPGWLYETTRFTAARLLRTNARRQQREQEAYMQSALNEADTADVWERLSPHLEEAMSQLAERDRALLVLRFYQNKSGPEAAALMGVREGAAHMRVTRAIEKLRKFLAQRGVTLSGETIAGAISANSVQAAPMALAKAATAAAIAKGATASTSTLTLIKGALKTMAWTKVKTMAAGAAVLIAAGATTGVVVHLNIPHRLELAAGRRAIVNHLAEPLDLTTYYDKQAAHFDNEWMAVPTGFQTFCHVPFKIDGSLQLWGSGGGGKEIVDVPVSRRFETLYVYHTAIFWSPNRVPIYQLVFRYNDGESVTNTIRYGTDILDWFATPDKRGGIPGPTGHNSKLAWHGVYSANGKNTNLRFSLTALPNPNPLTEVTSIDLYSCRENSCGCILAMTTGKSGLMK